MTIKNQHRKGIARLCALAVVIVGGVQFAVPAHGQSEKDPSPAAMRHFEERSGKAARFEAIQAFKQDRSDSRRVRFVPEVPKATLFLASKVEVARVDGTKVSMTVESAMYDSLKQFDQAMNEAKRWENKRTGAFNGQDQKINAKAFDAAVVRAGNALDEYRLLLAKVDTQMKDSFGKLLHLVQPEELKLIPQNGLPTRLADIVAKSDLRYTWVQGGGVHGVGETYQYDEFLNLQKAMKSDNWAAPNKQTKTQLGVYLEQIREAESKGLVAPMESLKVDVTNINPNSSNAKELINAAKRKQPVSLAIQTALKKAPRVPSGGPVALVVGAAGFAASSAVMAGEVDAVEAKASEAPAEFNRSGWARSRPTSR